jgi:transposase
MRKTYPSDLSDKQWGSVKPFFEPSRPKGGRPRTHSARLLVNAILYFLRNGIHWEAMPKDFPPWKTVYSQFTRWVADGTLERAMRALAPSSV